MINEQLNRIENKLEEIRAEQAKMNVVQASQASDLKYHIKRTDLLEMRVDNMQKYVYMGLGIAAVAGLLAKVIL